MSDSPDKTYAAFLSYSRKYAELVLQLALKLKEAGIQYWLDKEQILGGDNFMDKMEEGVKKSKTFLAIFEKEKPSGWFKDEIDFAQIRGKEEKDFIVIPVLLPGADISILPTFLKSKDVIVFKNSLDDAPAFEKLVKSIKRPEDLNPDPKQKKSIKGALTLIPRPTTVIGREDRLADIAQAFKKNKKEIILVNGLGGIGKTTVALEYAWQQNNFDHVAWLEITDKIPEAFINNVSLKKALKVNELLSKVPPQQLSTQGFELILSAMNQLPGENLLILDNANDHDELMEQMEYLQTLQWKILFTSRIDSHLLSSDLHPIAIDELPLGDAVTLFKTHFDFENDQQALVEDLIGKLHRHTLLIELVARAGTQQKVALSELAELVYQEFIHHEKLNEEAIRTGKYAGRKGMPKIERISLYIQKFFQEITELTEDEKQYLRYLCLLPSNDYTKEELVDFFQVNKKSKRDFSDVLSGLVKKGLLSYKATEEKNSYKLHALVQDVGVRELEPDAENCEVVIKTFINKLWIDQSKDNPVDKLQWIPFGERIVELIEALVYGEIIELFYWLAFNYRYGGQYQKAKELLEPALSFVEKQFGGIHSKTAVYLNDLGNTLRDLGEYDRASELLEKALDSDIKEYGKNHERVAIRQSNLGIVYRRLGEYEKARNILEKALVFDLENFGPKHYKVAIDQSNLANVYVDLGEYEKARDLHEKALISDLENFGANHPYIATDQINLGSVYYNMGNKATAKDYFQKAYDLFKELLGEAHPETKNAKDWLDLVS